MSLNINKFIPKMENDDDDDDDDVPFTLLVSTIGA